MNHFELVDSYFPELLEFSSENNCKAISSHIESLYFGCYVSSIGFLRGYIFCLHDDGKISDHQFCSFYAELDDFEEDFIIRKGYQEQ